MTVFSFKAGVQPFVLDTLKVVIHGEVIKVVVGPLQQDARSKCVGFRQQKVLDRQVAAHCQIELVALVATLIIHKDATSVRCLKGSQSSQRLHPLAQLCGYSKVVDHKRRSRESADDMFAAGRPQTWLLVKRKHYVQRPKQSCACWTWNN